ncbi:MAG: helix-turn-helix domain-containing protein [Actinomycetota bacterium]|nr:helix-turn-helix domain-containing protein [Actinomycetota bacterium]
MDGGLLIREARLRAGLTQAELAQRAGTSQPAVARYERGDVSPRVATLDRVVRACGLELVPALVAYDDHDRTLYEPLLRMTPNERLEHFLAVQDWAVTLRAARRLDA